MKKWQLTTANTAATRDLGRRLGRHLPAGAVLCLTGDLGAGKTHLTQGIAAGLDISCPVTSPTFTIVNQYPGGRLALNHLDMYRVREPEELWELGIEEYFTAQSAVVVEWPEILGDILPADAVWLKLERFYAGGQEKRRITITAPAATAAWLEEALAENADFGD